jgi:type I restriction enzyme R subunit
MNDEPRTYRTKTGRVFSDAEIEALADEAEQGYDINHLAKKPGRPRMGSAPAVVVPVRLHADMHDAIKALAESDRTSLSELVRDALRYYLATPAAPRSLRTASGRVLSDADVRALADEGEAGHDITSLRAQPTRRAGERARVVPVRMPPELKAAVEKRADAESTSVSEIVRAALRARVEGGHTDPPDGDLRTSASWRTPGENPRQAEDTADTGPAAEDYLTPEARARVAIDRMLVTAGWAVQNYSSVNLGAALGVAVREFVMKQPHGRTDYLLFVDGKAAGAVEAKPAGTTLTGVSWQTGKYADGLPDALPELMRPLPFLFQSTGYETRFTNLLDPDAASRNVFGFHRPETLQRWFEDAVEDNDHPTLRARLRAMPRLDPVGLWPAQERAIRNTERLLAENRPRVLIQMATGAGKTFTAANVALRLVKHAHAGRVLFLVDRANLGKQTLKEFQGFTIPETQRKFTDEYVVQHLTSNSIDATARVVITTIQRLYSILRGEPELDPELDETSPYDLAPPAPVPVEYNAAVPPEMFDVVIVDECHRSIYGVWRQVLDYFDSFIIGLTATPNKQAFGFFNQCLASEYTHDQAVADGVNVDFDVYRIRTEITERGSTIDAGLVTGFRDRATRAVRWEQVDEAIDYGFGELDRAVVAKDQFRTVIRTFRERLFTDIFPGRRDVPKTLIFAKDDSHADDIVQIVREEFGKGDDWAVKITYKSTGRKTDDMIAEFRNSYLPRVAVTVDMIATGTDVKPLECVFFMRSVRSRTFFEQMKGRGVRVINDADFQAVTPDAKSKTRFVIVDAVGVTDNDDFAETKPLERLPTQPLDSLLRQISFGNREPAVVSSIASRLARLDRQLTKADREEVESLAGSPLGAIAGALVDALDPDVQYAAAQTATGKPDPTAEDVAAAAKTLLDAAAAPLANNPHLRGKLVDVRRSYEQTIDETSQDRVLSAGYSVDAADRARSLAMSFREFIEEHHEEITALEILYSRPHAQRLTFREIKELANAIGRPPRSWTPDRLWQAYEALDKSRVRGSGQRTLTDIVSLVRFALEQEPELVPYSERVNKRFEAWLLAQQNAGQTFTDEQLAWLTRIKDHLATSLTVTPDDFAFTPFVEHGGLGRAYDVFGGRLNDVLEELTEALVA